MKLLLSYSGFMLLFLFQGVSLKAQQNIHAQSTTYEWPSDSLVKKKLDKWQDQKFGMIIHWGLYSVPGIIESWSICSEDWIERDSTVDYASYKKAYWDLKNDFNPIKFDPAKWAQAGKDAGMKYIVFTTKHHDGFNMFDTKESDFKISSGPFRNNPKANVAKYVFDAFRKNDFMIGAYFSKPDWHSENYWWPKYATPDRNNNYDIRKFPWRWNKFKQSTFNQIQELMSEYGSMDILWLDGGWVRPLETVNEEVLSWGSPIPSWSQNIDMPSIAKMARKAQPGLLIVDRTVHGTYENYQTPEQKIPENQLDHPWESCLTLANNWGYVANDQFKSANKIIHTLIEVVAKGGSLLLGVGPKPDGTLSDTAIQRLEQIGEWLKPNGSAIYETRTMSEFKEGNIYFTKHKTSNLKYALVCLPENSVMPQTIEWEKNLPKKGTKIVWLQTGEIVSWKIKDANVKVTLPKAAFKNKPVYPALAFSFEGN